jgi:hypothetical protein
VLPTEHPGRVVPSDQSYGMLATWKNMDGVKDLVLTQGQGNQLFVLFNQGGTGGPDVPRGDVKLFPLTRPEAIGAPYFDPMKALYNPVAIAAATNKLFVLDQGDTCLAKFDVVRGTCEADPTPVSADTTKPQPRRNMIRDYRATWRVREYGLRRRRHAVDVHRHDVRAALRHRRRRAGTCLRLGPRGRARHARHGRAHPHAQVRVARLPDTAAAPSTRASPTATCPARPRGVATPRGSCSTAPAPRRFFGSARHPLDAHGREPAVHRRSWQQSGEGRLDRRGGRQHRPRGRAGDRREPQCIPRPSRRTSPASSTSSIADNRRVLRYSQTGEYIQRVDVEVNADGLPLLDPVGIAVDDSLAYVADRGRAQILRYRRRK